MWADCNMAWKMRPSPSPSVGYTGLWMICWCCLTLLDCGFLCGEPRLYFFTIGHRMLVYARSRVAQLSAVLQATVANVTLEMESANDQQPASSATQENSTEPLLFKLVSTNNRYVSLVSDQPNPYIFLREVAPSPAVFVPTNLPVFKETSGDFQPRVFGNQDWIFSPGRSRHLLTFWRHRSECWYVDLGKYSSRICCQKKIIYFHWQYQAMCQSLR